MVARVASRYVETTQFVSLYMPVYIVSNVMLLLPGMDVLDDVTVLSAAEGE